MEEKNHIYPIFDRMMTRQDKEELLGQSNPRLWSSRSNAIAIVLLPEPLNPVNQIITLLSLIHI